MMQRSSSGGRLIGTVIAGRQRPTGPRGPFLSLADIPDSPRSHRDGHGTQRVCRPARPVPQGQSSISEIVTRTDIAQSRVSTCIKQLAERGWVLTTAEPTDGRKTLASVTERVKDEGARRRTMNAQEALTPLLTECSPHERRAITDALERLYELAVDARDETLKPRHMGPQAKTRRDAALPMFSTEANRTEGGGQRDPARSKCRTEAVRRRETPVFTASEIQHVVRWRSRTAFGPEYRLFTRAERSGGRTKSRAWESLCPGCVASPAV